MPKIYYCEHCHQFSHREGFRFEIVKIHRNTCIVCKNKLRVFEVDHTNWVKIGTPLGIIFGFFVFIITSYLAYSPEIPIRDVVINTLFMLVVSILIMIGIAGGLSLFDPDTAAKKILKEHPELVEKKLKAQYKRLPNHCNQCDKELPVGINKCPYCGQEQY